MVYGGVIGVDDTGSHTSMSVFTCKHGDSQYVYTLIR